MAQVRCCAPLQPSPPRLGRITAVLVHSSRWNPAGAVDKYSSGVEVEVRDILSAADRAEEVNGHLRAMTQNAGAAQSAEAGHVGGDDDEAEDDESHSADLHESMSARHN